MSLIGHFLFIVIARVIDVSMGTLRVSFIARGRKYHAAFCGFIEIFIWIAVVSRVLTGEHNIYSYISYAAGFAAGTLVGMSIEERLAVGQALVRVITSSPVMDFMETLSSAGFGVTRQEAFGARGPVHVLVILMPRRHLPLFLPLLHEFDPTAFYTIEDVRRARDTPSAYATATTAAGKVRMPPV